MAKRKKVSTPAIWNHLCLLKTGVGDEESFVFFLLLTFLLLIINCILLKRTKHVFHFFLFQGDKDWDFYSKGTKVYFFCSLSAKIPNFHLYFMFLCLFGMLDYPIFEMLDFLFVWSLLKLLFFLVLNLLYLSYFYNVFGFIVIYDRMLIFSIMIG